MADVLIVSPHLDDAALSCWSVLNRPGAPAGTVTVLDFCAGLPPAGVLGAWDARGGATSSRLRVRQRRAEEAAALAGTGARVVLLDLLDWQYEPEGEDVAAVLAPYLAGAGWVLAPAAIGSHRDHLRVRDAVLELHPEAVLYADLPYALRRGFEPPLPAYEPEERALLEADYGPVLDPRALAREVFFHRV